METYRFPGPLPHTPHSCIFRGLKPTDLRHRDPELSPADEFSEQAMQNQTRPPVVVQYVLSEERQTLASGTSTVLFAFCAMSPSQLTPSYVGRMYLSPRLDKAYSSSSPDTTPQPQGVQPSTICWHIEPSPPAAGFRRGRWEGSWNYSLNQRRT